MDKLFLITVDVDPNPPAIPYFLNIEHGVNIILNLLDKYDIKATFFIPSTLALRFSEMIKKIVERKHEIGCHGMEHNSSEVYKSSEEQIEIIKKATEAIKSVSGFRPLGYRAALFKITDKSFVALAKNNYIYDSSVICSPFYNRNIRWLLNPRPFFIHVPGMAKTLLEVPVSINPLFLLPFGGAYLRLLGSRWGKCCIKYNFSNRKPVVFYIHPKDIVPKRYGKAWYSYRNTEKCVFMVEELIKYAIKKRAVFIKAIELAKRLIEFSKGNPQRLYKVN